MSWKFSPEAWEFKASVKNPKIKFIEIGKEILNGLLISNDMSTEHKNLYKERVKGTFKEPIKAKESELRKEKEEIQKEKKKESKKLPKSRREDS